MTRVLDERRAGHAEFGILRESTEQELEVVGVEGDVGIQIADKIELELP